MKYLSPEIRKCPDCGAEAGRLEWEIKIVPYGHPESWPINIPTYIPMWSCGKCGMRYTDEEGDELGDLQVQLYLQYLRRVFKDGWKL